MRFILPGRHSIWWSWRVTFVAARIGIDVSYVKRITHAIHFAWQAPYLVKLEAAFCCSVYVNQKHTKTILYFIDFKKRQQKDSIRQGTVCGARIRVPSPSARPWLFEMLTEIEECCLEGQQKQKHCRHPCQFHPKFQPISINLISIHHSCTLQLANSQSPLQWFIQPRRVYPASPGSCRILRQRMQLEWWPIHSKTLSLHVNVRLNKYEDISQTPAANVITIQSYSIRFIWHCNAVAMEQFGHTATCLT